MTSIEYGPRLRLSEYVTEKMIEVDGEPVPGLAAPRSSVVTCPPGLVHDTGAAWLAAGVIRFSAIARTSESEATCRTD